MDLSIQFGEMPRRVYLRVGYGGWAGYESILLYGDGAALAAALPRSGDWYYEPAMVGAFADWVQEEIGTLTTINQFRQPDRAWWDALPDLIRARAVREVPMPLPRWA